MKFAIATSYLLAATAAAATAVAADAQQQDECRLWMAQSHLMQDVQTAVKFGLFAGVSLQKGDLLPNQAELAIPAVDFLDQANRQSPPDKTFNNNVLDYLENFMWTSDFAAGAKWEGNYSSTLWIPGIGIHANYHAGTHNVDWVHEAVIFRDPSFTGIAKAGEAHPARGAISPYYNLTLRATEAIPAGMELFANFGDVWESNAVSENDDIFQQHLNRRHYAAADTVVKKLVEFYDKYGGQLSDKMKDKILDFLLFKVLGTASGKQAKIVRSLIPAHVDKLQRVLDAGGTFHYRNVDLIKSPKWLRTHGLCVDTVRSGVSTIPEAGRGAFATRAVDVGQIILPVPVVPVCNKYLLQMFKIEEHVTDKKKGSRTQEYNRNEQLNHQLLFNYAFGHPESSMVLLPTGPMIAHVNHADTNGRPGRKANAKLMWSTHDYIVNDFELHSMSIDDINNWPQPVMTLILVATEKIQPGEEIFLDYGDEWKQAWKQYHEEWKQQAADKPWPLRAEDARLSFANQPYGFDIDSETFPYPEGVATTCFILHDELPDGVPHKTPEGVDIYRWVGPANRSGFAGQQMYVCDLMERKPDPVHFYNYTVLTRLVENDPIVQVVNVPHSAVYLVDQPYASDLHVQTPIEAFRHYIGLEDSIWPHAWRDLRD